MTGRTRKDPRPLLKMFQKDASNALLPSSVVDLCGFIFDISPNNGPIKRGKMYVNAGFLVDPSHCLGFLLAALIC